MPARWTALRWSLTQGPHDICRARGHIGSRAAQFTLDALLELHATAGRGVVGVETYNATFGGSYAAGIALGPAGGVGCHLEAMTTRCRKQQQDGGRKEDGPETGHRGRRWPRLRCWIGQRHAQGGTPADYIHSRRKRARSSPRFKPCGSVMRASVTSAPTHEHGGVIGGGASVQRR